MTLEEYESLYQSNEKALFNCAMRWVWNRDEAQDLVQETFLKLWEHRSRIRNETARAYLFRTAMNLSAKRVRWKKTWTFLGLSGLTVFSKSSEEHLLEKERNKAIQNALETLPQKNRQVMMLARFTECSYREIATILDIPEGTVASRYHTAIQRLKKKLGGIDAN